MKLIYPDYNNSILNVTNSILKHYGVDVKYSTIPILDSELEKNYNHIIYILLDGLGVNVIKNHLKKADALQKYLKKEITSVFPPTTVAATDTVLSGLPPISNGHLGWVQYFKNEDTNLVVFQNKDFYTGKIFEEDLREKYLSFKKIYEQITDINPHIPANEFFPSFREGGSKSFNEEIERVLLSTHNTDQSFNYVYWVEPDLSQHEYGVYSKEVKQIVKNLNTDFEDLISNITDDTLVICIADHGLTDVEETPLYDHKEVTDLLVRKTSLEPRATNFFVQDGKHKLFKENFNKAFSDKFKLLSKQEILDSKLFGEGPMHPMVNEFLGDFISIATSNYMFGLTDTKGYIAHHAGMSADEMIVPLIIYSKK
jgi:hypothetical protein